MKFILFFFVFVTLLVNGQTKFEKESRLSKSLVPSNALNFIRLIENKKSIKWYKEENMDKESVEAKFKISKVKYSVEFDTLGKLEDIEYEVSSSVLDSTLLSQIKQAFNKDFAHFKINKIQEQLKGSELELIQYFKKENIHLVSGYEVVVEGTKEHKVNLYEYFFDKLGNVKSREVIIIKSSVHLDY